MRNKFLIGCCYLLLFTFSCSENVKDSSNIIIPQNLIGSSLREYIQSNAKEMERISLTELSSLDIGVQRHIHRVLTPEKKYTLWNEKFDRMIAQSWTEEEKKYLNDFKSMLSVELFSLKSNSKELIEFRDYAENWRSETIKVLGWNSQSTKNIIMSYTMKDPISIRKGEGSIINYSMPAQKECNCNTHSTWWCDDDPCVPYLESGCEWSNPGCGTLLMYDCNGYCPNS